MNNHDYVSIDDLLSRLDGVKKTGTGKWVAKCPTNLINGARFNAGFLFCKTEPHKRQRSQIKKTREPN